jgi:cytochrome oxidase Cu insertion factor (SCO1/SenC/PrrC family)
MIGLAPFLSPALVAKAVQKSTLQRSQIAYVCPMDPDVKSVAPGKCRKCGMQLREAGRGAPPEAPDNASSADDLTGRLRLADEWVTDQHGRKLRFYSDLIKSKTVAIEFIFTTCTTICPPLTAMLRRVQQQLATSGTSEVQVISITVDPETDTPERLSAFSSKFGAGPGWSFITGGKREITHVLKALGGNVADKNQHSPTMVIGNDRAGYWTRAYGLAPASTLVRVINDAASRTPTLSDAAGRESATPVSQAPPRKQGGEVEEPGAKAPQLSGPTKLKTPEEAAASYFPNVVLRTQDNKPVQFFSDLLKGKTVLINFVFTTCTGVCPAMTSNLKKVQDQLGERVGNDITMISVTVDPAVDTPEALKKYALSFGVKPGWYFVTGPPADVDLVLRKLGGFVQDKNDHTNLLIVGNVESGNWIKVFALARPAEIVAQIIKLAPPK